MALWLQRHYTHISAGFGGLLLAMAVIATVVAPVEQRGEVVVVTILFGLIGALMLFLAVAAPSTGTAPSTGNPGTERPQPSVPVRASAVSRKPVRVDQPGASRARLRERQARQAKLRAVAGFAFGLLFAVTGVAAPFVLSEGQSNADARFLMVVGFAPVVVSGVLMMAVFARSLGIWGEGAAHEHEPVAPQAGPSNTDTTSNSNSILSGLATVSAVSGALLVVCALVLPFVVSDAARAGTITTSVEMALLGIVLSLVGVMVRRRGGATDPTAANAAKAPVRRAPVPRVPVNVLYRVVVPAAIGLAIFLILAVIGVIILATVTPLLH
jgi:hypothetical protein